MDEILRKLVAFHTVADDRQSIHEAIDYIATFVAEHGMHVERFELDGHEALVATVRPGYKTPKVMLAAHLDVVPAADEMFEIRLADGKLYGRGVLDMKFAIAAYLQLIDDLQGKLHLYDIGLVITSDEEQAGQSARHILAEGYIPQVCVLPDGGDNWQVQVSSKAFRHLQIHKYGTLAHGSRPWLGDNAILPLLHALQEVQTLTNNDAPEKSTLNIGTFKGGTAINQVADYAEASLDIRTRTDAEMQSLSAQIENICKKYGIEYTCVSEGMATHFDLDNPLIAPFITAITAVTGISINGSHTLGSNDTRFYAERGVPCISLYPTGAGHHGPEEWIEDKAFYQFKEVLRRYLDEIARR